MDITAVLTEIGAALNDIPNVTGYAKQPGSPKAGDAWGQFVGITFEAGIPEVSWRAYIWLPQNEDQARAWIGANLEALRRGLTYPDPEVSDGFYVDSINTVNLGLTNNPVFGLEINMRS